MGDAGSRGHGDRLIRELVAFRIGEEASDWTLSSGVSSRSLGSVAHPFLPVVSASGGGSLLRPDAEGDSAVDDAPLLQGLDHRLEPTVADLHLAKTIRAITVLPDKWTPPAVSASERAQGAVPTEGADRFG